MKDNMLDSSRWKLRPHSSPIRRIAFSPDGLFLASCAWETTVHIWKLHPLLTEEPEHIGDCRAGGKATDVIWCPNPNQRRFLTLSSREIILWQVRQKEVSSLLGHSTNASYTHLFLVLMGVRQDRFYCPRFDYKVCGLDAKWKPLHRGDRIVPAYYRMPYEFLI